MVLIVPALLLPTLAGLAMILTQNTDGGIDNGVGGVALLVYLFVLLGSMTLNAWLLLRHPHTLARRALPRSPSVVLVALWVLLLAWAVVLGAPVPVPVSDGLTVAFAIGGIVLSVMSFFIAVARRVADVDRVPRATVELGERARVILWAYLVTAGLALLSYTALTAMGGVYSQVGGLLGGPASWALVMLGLPWSHPLYTVSVVGAVTLFSGLGGLATAISTVIPVVGAAINVVLACLLLFSPTHRTRLVNWFFRLKSRPARTPALAPPQ